eukprot:3519644-Pyramimonas_sp.AAC.1
MSEGQELLEACAGRLTVSAHARPQRKGNTGTCRQIANRRRGESDRAVARGRRNGARSSHGQHRLPLFPRVLRLYPQWRARAPASLERHV